MKLTTLPLPRQKSIKQGFVNHFLILSLSLASYIPSLFSFCWSSSLSLIVFLCQCSWQYAQVFLISVTFSSSSSEWHCIMTLYSFMDSFFHRQKCHQYIKINEMKFFTIETFLSTFLLPSWLFLCYFFCPSLGRSFRFFQWFFIAAVIF